ncbi:acyltransferase family protein [Poseidonocella sedimentorum]|uniref:Peptidoglycan/LPS O-acetylase OafA/YrhL, contains acyltransferase and SGNH-hydrolase domains n=1 Tax=Poseidonocella sedimentorum TaxID=871652 RepID=A0A1I6DVP5_9RHOB|nr:acyltransferase [Poseidonocella sedimentorum]SFR09506.1 Peptidoglycan/LPS O-acetylase OafA/YrhL, contains acyltransferase and SGNH-hydrolase domains [Poseidonocella sedimentorum]
MPVDAPLFAAARSTPAPRTGYYTQLDSFRGIAALLVVWFHSPFAAGPRPALIASAELCVDFFFVLSGFVLMHAYGARIAAGMSFRRFALLRLARLWPLHLFMLALFVAFGLAQEFAALAGVGSGARAENTIPSLLANIALLQGLRVEGPLSWNYPSWSISVEFYAYLLFFAVIALAGRARFLAAGLLCGAGYLWLARSGAAHLADPALGVPRVLAGFFAGVLIYALHARLPDILPRGAQSACEVAILAATGLLLARAGGDVALQFTTMGAFALLILVFAQGGGVLSGLCASAPMRHLGRLSFSVYMSHAFVLMLAGWSARRVFGVERVEIPGRSAPVLWTEHAGLITAALVLLILGLSHLLYTRIERPGQRLFQRLFGLR